MYYVKYLFSVTGSVYLITSKWNLFLEKYSGMLSVTESLPIFGQLKCVGAMIKDTALMLKLRR